jgi:hypothetical protein
MPPIILFGRIFQTTTSIQHQETQELIIMPDNLELPQKQEGHWNAA